LRELQSPNLRREALQNFFDACLPETMKQLPNKIHRIYMLLDSISTIDLIRLLEHRKDKLLEDKDTDPEVLDAVISSLTFLNSKRESIAIRTGTLPALKLLPETEWVAPSSSQKRLEQSTRRDRLRRLRAQWRQTRQSPSRLLRKVRFAQGSDSPDTEEYVTAPETMSSLSKVKSSASDSSEVWFVARESQSGWEA
jgi:hypothetical protein